MTKCTKPGCKLGARRIPKVIFRAFEGASPAEMFFDLPRCDAHPVRRGDELLTDHVWTGLVVAMVSAGKLAPRRDLTKVEMMLIKGYEAQEFYRLRELGKTLKVEAPSGGVN